jgi:GNAT superfamily N-acetyltransferase
MPDSRSNFIRNIEIRQAVVNDKPKIVDLIHHTVKTDYPLFYPQGVVDFFLEYHNPKSISGNIAHGFFLVAEDENQLLATGCLRNHEIGSVYIHPDHRKKGIGRRIVNELIMEAKRKKLDKIYLDSTINARLFYERLGFGIVSTECQILENNVPLDYYRMVYEMKD